MPSFSIHIDRRYQPPTFAFAAQSIAVLMVRSKCRQNTDKLSFVLILDPLAVIAQMIHLSWWVIPSRTTE